MQIIISDHMSIEDQIKIAKYLRKKCAVVMARDDQRPVEELDNIIDRTDRLLRIAASLENLVYERYD